MILQYTCWWLATSPSRHHSTPPCPPPHTATDHRAHWDTTSCICNVITHICRPRHFPSTDHQRRPSDIPCLATCCLAAVPSPYADNCPAISYQTPCVTRHLPTPPPSNHSLSRPQHNRQLPFLRISTISVTHIPIYRYSAVFGMHSSSSFIPAGLERFLFSLFHRRDETANKDQFSQGLGEATKPRSLKTDGTQASLHG